MHAPNMVAQGLGLRVYRAQRLGLCMTLTEVLRFSRVEGFGLFFVFCYGTWLSQCCYHQIPSSAAKLPRSVSAI